jgi:hypothetical protein
LKNKDYEAAKAAFVKKGLSLDYAKVLATAILKLLKIQAICIIHGILLVLVITAELG